MSKVEYEWEKKQAAEKEAAQVWVAAKAEAEAREAQIQRIAEMMYAAQFARLSYIATVDAHEDARATAATWAKLVREGKLSFPEFKP
jgi:hypothetical protein